MVTNKNRKVHFLLPVLWILLLVACADPTKPAADSGTLRVLVSWPLSETTEQIPAGEVSMYRATLSRPGYGELTSENSIGTFSFEGITSGIWTAAVVAMNASGNTIGSGEESVEILPGVSVDLVMDIQGTSGSDSDGGIIIVFENPLNPEIPFTGVEPEVSQGEPLTVSIPDVYVTYRWYLDGVDAEISGPSASFDTAGLSLGTHLVTVVVDGLYSGRFSFDVVHS